MLLFFSSQQTRAHMTDTDVAILFNTNHRERETFSMLFNNLESNALLLLNVDLAT